MSLLPEKKMQNAWWHLKRSMKIKIIHKNDKQMNNVKKKKCSATIFLREIIKVVPGLKFLALHFCSIYLPFMTCKEYRHIAMY